jgi:hypothetical protein
MPPEVERLDVERGYSRDEFAWLCFGVVPASMDEKWFVYYEAPWLSLHRSWTGTCVYRVRFEPDGEGARIAEAIVNREGGGHGPADAGQLLYLLDSVVERNARRLRGRVPPDGVE